MKNKKREQGRGREKGQNPGSVPLDCRQNILVFHRRQWAVKCFLYNICVHSQSLCVSFKTFCFQVSGSYKYNTTVCMFSMGGLYFFSFPVSPGHFIYLFYSLSLSLQLSSLYSHNPTGNLKIKSLKMSRLWFCFAFVFPLLSFLLAFFFIISSFFSQFFLKKFIYLYIFIYL